MWLNHLLNGIRICLLSRSPGPLQRPSCVMTGATPPKNRLTYGNLNPREIQTWFKKKQLFDGENTTFYPVDLPCSCWLVVVSNDP